MAGHGEYFPFEIAGLGEYFPFSKAGLYGWNIDFRCE